LFALAGTIDISKAATPNKTKSKFHGQLSFHEINLIGISTIFLQLASPLTKVTELKRGGERDALVMM
jgi:hypothetical protein